ncbi:MAG: hypothetical protein M3R21_06320 [Candidatus Dormibacteraeota bacterium]|nr:hypothetical protein [Candidatus Dormibacteraeota bacterium]
MHTSMKWRIVTLQAIMVAVLAFASGFALYEGAFVTNMVNDQLAAQKVFFPPQSAVVTGGALDPAEFGDITQYAGQQVNNGEKAAAYGNGFIGRHLAKVAGGLTYSQVGSLAGPVNAELATTAKTDPNYAVLQAKLATIAGQKATLFQGEMLRATLLNAWGWSQMGMYTTIAGLFLMVATLIVLGALVFELFFAGRKVESKAKVLKPAIA